MRIGSIIFNVVHHLLFTTKMLCHAVRKLKQFFKKFIWLGAAIYQLAESIKCVADAPVVAINFRNPDP